MSSPRRTLLFFSGGLDSSCLLRKILLETDDILTVFYFQLSERHAYALWTQRAIDNILIKAKEIRDFEIITKSSNYRVVSMMVTRPEAANLYFESVQNQQPYDRICTGRCQADLSSPKWLHRVNLADRAFNQQLKKIAPELVLPVNEIFDYPLENWSKAKIVDYLPADWIEFCWSCFRVKQKDFNLKTIKLCGLCYGCQEVKQAVKELPKNREKLLVSPWKTLL